MKIKLSTKLMISFLAVGLVPLAIVSVLSLQNGTKALSKAAFNQLTSVRDIKKKQIEDYFKSRQGDLTALVETVGAIRAEAIHKLEALREVKKDQIQNYFNSKFEDLRILASSNTVHLALDTFDAAFKADGGKIGTGWQRANVNAGRWLANFNKTRGYYDTFLINLQGDIVFSVAQEPDLGQNLSNGQLKTSPLGKLLLKTSQGLAFQDYEPYAPSNNEPAAFMGIPIAKNGKIIGTLAFQVSTQQVNKIMQARVGMGKTGETYLVGADHRMRSDSFLDPQGHSVKASFAGTVTKNGVNTASAQEALNGKSGAHVASDYNNNSVLSAFSPLKIMDTTWAILPEIDAAEAFSPVDVNGVEYFSKYQKAYGYYDIFLINPDGYVFYSASREADFQTNMVNGKFASSNLGNLVQKVIKTKAFGFADFKPYAPSKGEPASFIAAPFLDPADAELELIIGLQLSLKDINTVMTQREGMGKTGETYLVGADHLMRSDSFLDKTFHSVKASFAEPTKGSVKTEATHNALNGQTQSKIINDYNGNPVLSAFAPLHIFGETWALIAEIDKAEAFESTDLLFNLIITISLIGLTIILLLAFVIGKSIANPILAIAKDLDSGAGEIGNASLQVSESSQQIAKGLVSKHLV